MSRQTVAVGNTGAAFVSALNANFLQLYRGYIKQAEDYGFLTSASPATNTAALQAAVTGGGTVFLKAGTYEMNDTILLDDNTWVIAEPGTILKKTGSYCHVMLNRGALTREWNENIIIDNLEVEVNGVDNTSTGVLLNAHLSFYYINNLIVRNYRCLDGAANVYHIGLCRWQNVTFENFYVKSQSKDGFQIQTGHDGVFRNGIIECRDDNFALATVNGIAHIEEIGDIYNVTIDNVIGRAGSGQISASNFCRAMGASWTDWTSGFTYQTGSLCLNAGHLYQCANVAETGIIGTVAPVHHSGDVTGADGVIWRYKQDSTAYHTDIYNIKFINTTAEDRTSFLKANLYNNPGLLESAYVGTEDQSKMYNISLVNCTAINNGTFGNGLSVIVSNGSLTSIRVSGCHFENFYALYYGEMSPNFNNNLAFSLTDNTLLNEEYFFVYRIGVEAINLITSGNIAVNCDLKLVQVNASTLRMNGTDLELFAGHRAAYLTPVLGDMVKDAEGVWIYKAAGWVNLAV